MNIETTIKRATEVSYWSTEAQLKLMYDFCRECVSENKRAIAEFGVAKGASALVLAHVADEFDVPLYLFDTFAGCPAPSKFDGPEMSRIEGKCRGDSKEVQWLLKKNFPTVETHVHVGEFKDTLAEFNLPPLSFVNYDSDLFLSTKDALEASYDLINGGATLNTYWKPAVMAVTEFLIEHRFDDLWRNNKRMFIRRK